MVALNNGVIQHKDGRSFDRSTGTWEEPNENSSTETQQADTKEAQTHAEKKPSDAKTPNQNAEQKPSDAKTPNQNAKTPKTLLEIPEPRTIYYNIDGNQVHISVNDWPRFQELRAQLASGTTLNDDLMKKMKPILAETHLPDGTKIFNDETKLSHQLDDIMKHHRGKEISSLNDVLRLVLHTIR